MKKSIKKSVFEKETDIIQSGNDDIYASKPDDTPIGNDGVNTSKTDGISIVNNIDPTIAAIFEYQRQRDEKRDKRDEARDDMLTNVLRLTFATKPQTNDSPVAIINAAKHSSDLKMQEINWAERTKGLFLDNAMYEKHYMLHESNTHHNVLAAVEFAIASSNDHSQPYQLAPKLTTDKVKAAIFLRFGELISTASISDFKAHETSKISCLDHLHTAITNISRVFVAFFGPHFKFPMHELFHSSSRLHIQDEMPWDLIIKAIDLRLGSLRGFSPSDSDKDLSTFLSATLTLNEDDADISLMLHQTMKRTIKDLQKTVEDLCTFQTSKVGNARAGPTKSVENHPTNSIGKTSHWKELTDKLRSNGLIGELPCFNFLNNRCTNDKCQRAHAFDPRDAAQSAKYHEIVKLHGVPNTEKPY